MSTREQREHHIRTTIERLHIEVAALDANLELLLDFQDTEDRDIGIATTVASGALDNLNGLNWRLFHILYSEVNPPTPDESPYATWGREIAHLRPLLRPPLRAGRAYTQTSGQCSDSWRRRRRPRFVYVVQPSPTQAFRRTPQEIESRIRERATVATERRVRRRFPNEVVVDVINESDDSDQFGREAGGN
jgi:hypothetical protein